MSPVAWIPAVVGAGLAFAMATDGCMDVGGYR